MKNLLLAVALLVPLAAFAEDSTNTVTPPPAVASTSPGKTSAAQADEWRQRAATAAAKDSATVVEAGEKVPSISVVVGPTIIRGVVEGPVSSVQGDVFVLGTVRGGISSVSGDVYVLGEVLGPVNIVSGKLHNAGRVTGATTSVCGGNFSKWSSTKSYSGAWNRSHVSPDQWKHAAQQFVVSVFAFVWRASWAVLWIALALLVTALFTSTIEGGVGFLSNQPARTIAVGVLWKFAYWLLLIVFVIASFLLIGFPFLMLLLCVQWALVLLGYPILFLALGRRLIASTPGGATSIYGALLAGGAAFGVVRVIPIVGDIAWWLTGIYASGLAIRYLFSLRPPVPAPTPIPPLPSA